MTHEEQNTVTFLQLKLAREEQRPAPDEKRLNELSAEACAFMDKHCRTLEELEDSLTPNHFSMLMSDPKAEEYIKRVGCFRFADLETAKLKAAKIGFEQVQLFRRMFADITEEQLRQRIESGRITRSMVHRMLKEHAKAKEHETKLKVLTADQKRSALVALISQSGCETAEVLADELQFNRTNGKKLSPELRDWLGAHRKVLQPPSSVAPSKVPEWLFDQYGITLKIDAVKKYVL